MKWSDNIDEIRKCLGLLCVTDVYSNDMDADSAYDQWTDMTVRVRDQRRTVFLIGNGASASMASHVAADLAKNGHIRTEVFTDLSLITAIANDVSFEAIFSEPLSRRISEGDMVVAISSSGRSPNILRAIELAKQRGGSTVTLSAMQPDNPLRRNGEVNFYVPADTYGMAETCHAALLHYWIDKVVAK